MLPITIPDPLPPAITPTRTVIEFLVDQDLDEFGDTGLVARTWHWVLHGGGPGPGCRAGLQIANEPDRSSRRDECERP